MYIHAFQQILTKFLCIIISILHQICPLFSSNIFLPLLFFWRSVHCTVHGGRVGEFCLHIWSFTPHATSTKAKPTKTAKKLSISLFDKNIFLSQFQSESKHVLCLPIWSFTPQAKTATSDKTNQFLKILITPFHF